MSSNQTNGPRRRRRRAYAQIPERLQGATEFTDDPQLGDAIQVIELLKQRPDILDDLTRETTVRRRDGRNRMNGNWALVMLALVLGRYADIEPFYNDHQSSRLWEICGFATVPSYQTAWNRLTELEQFDAAFERAAQNLIRRACQHEDRIRRWVYVDGTGFETNAVFEHCCPDRDACRALGKTAKHLDRAGLELIHATKKLEMHEAPTPGRTAPGAMVEIPFEESPQEHPGRRRPRRTPYRYFRRDGHLYRLADPDAGGRRYGHRGRKPTYWVGGIDQAGISYFVGAPLAVQAIPANQQEHAHYEGICERMRTATGSFPEAVTADRGYSINNVFEFNTRNRIASVIAWRKHGGPRAPERYELDRDTHDRHGIPRCKQCGGPGDIESAGMGLYFARGEPRLRYRCQLRLPGCSTAPQSVACSENWRLLVPMSRRTETYHSLATGRSNLERVFRHWRERYGLAGNNAYTRARRVGFGWERVRLQAGLLLEWFRLCLRHGWIGSHRRRNGGEIKPWQGARRLASTLRARARHGLDLPYGSAARRAGHAPGPDPPPPQAGDDLPF